MEYDFTPVSTRKGLCLDSMPTAVSERSNCGRKTTYEKLFVGQGKYGLIWMYILNELRNIDTYYQLLDFDYLVVKNLGGSSF